MCFPVNFGKPVKSNKVERSSISNSIHRQFHVLKVAVASLLVNIFHVWCTLCSNFVELREYHLCLLLD